MESNLTMGEMIARYFLMMAIVIFAGFSGIWWLAVLALPTLLSAISGFCPIKYLLQKK
jgi:hypothetical protein